MKRSTDRILTTHVGSLPRPNDLVELYRDNASDGTHKGDVGLKDVADLLIKVKAQAYSVEAGNVRHEHEWKVWKTTKLPEGKLLIPGVVSHATNVLEHPELVADRIIRFAEIVGRENLIAGTDCGLGGRVHPQIAWAKLSALSEGAKLASGELWR